MSIWNSRYENSDYLFGTEPNDFLHEQAQQLPPQSRILCIGEGEGRNAVYLASLGHDVTAMDASAVGLSKAQRLAEARGLHIHTIHADLAHFHWEKEQWDAIISIFCHLPTSLRKQTHASIIESLKPNGFLILEGYTIEQHQFKTGGPSDPDMMYSAQILRTDFPHFSFTILQEIERYIQEGSAHQGHSAVVQCVAHKSNIAS